MTLNADELIPFVAMTKPNRNSSIYPGKTAPGGPETTSTRYEMLTSAYKSVYNWSYLNVKQV